jgi:hypothetical protein
MTLSDTAWPATEDEVTADRLTAALTGQAEEHEAWAGRNRADGHMAELATRAAVALRALAGELAIGDKHAANATARQIRRALETPTT